MNDNSGLVVEGDGVGVGVDVGIGVGVGVDVGIGVGVGVGVSAEVGVGAGEGVGIEVGATFFTGTPLSQTNFFPFLIQVNFFPPKSVVAPNLGHPKPLIDACDANVGTLIIRRIIERLKMRLIMKPNFLSEYL